MSDVNDLQLRSPSDDGDGKASTRGMQMIPIEQVSAIIQRLTAEQEARLQQQRNEIVREVLQSIRESGLGAVQERRSGGSSSLSQAASEARLPTSRPKHLGNHAAASTNRLDESLHALMLHSLSESGLDFPHVQRSCPNGHPIYSKQQRSSESDSRADSKPAQLDGRGKLDRKPQYVIISRAESSEEPSQLSTHVLLREDGSPESEGDVETRKDQERERSAQTQPPGTKYRRRGKTRQLGGIARDHPLRKASRGRHHSGAAELDGDAVNQSFQVSRTKIDHRTLAILDKSRALLDGTPAKAEVRVSVAELRDRYRAAVSSPDPPTQDTCNPSEYNPVVRDRDEDSPDASRHLQSSSQCRSRDVEHEGDQRVQRREEARSPSPVQCEIDLLRAPEHPPDDENEWENELARQILTIYATSVKAKAAAADTATNRPFSGASRGKLRALSTPSRDSRQSEAPTCSLPLLSQQQQQHQRQPERPDGSLLLKTPSRSTASVNFSWEPSQRLGDGRVVINMPSIPKPVWFAGTGAVKAVWCALTDGFGELTRETAPSPDASTAVPRGSMLCSHRLCEEVRHMEAQHKFLECVTAIESLLIALVRARGASELEIKLWKQLVVTCNAFASRCIDYKKFSAALQLMKQAEHLIDNSVLVGGGLRLELLAYLYDTYAHYYYRRRKPHAGLQYSAKALEIHARQSSWSHVAKSRLHTATLLSFQKKHAQALAHMGAVLALVEASRLEEAGGRASGQKLCLVAVCYNNLAVEQLHLRELEAASVAAENAQRLAKLCLSYSNRWLAQLDATRRCVALALATLMEPPVEPSRFNSCK